LFLAVPFWPGRDDLPIEGRERRFQLWRPARHADHRTLLRIFDKWPFPVIERQRYRAAANTRMEGAAIPAPSAAIAAPDCLMRLRLSIMTSFLPLIGRWIALAALPQAPVVTFSQG
jgi:hypothetical protein